VVRHVETQDLVKLQMFDQSIQTLVGRRYDYKRANGVVITFSLSNRESFANIENFMRDIRLYNSDCLIYVIGVFMDDIPQEVSVEEARAYCKRKEFPFIVVSPKTGYNVARAINGMVSAIYKKQNRKPKTPNTPPALQQW